MKTKSIFIISFIISIIIGTIIHFVYEWSGYNFIVGLLAPVNESVWEHLKLILVPATLFGIFFSFYTKKKATPNIDYMNFWYYLAGNIVIGMCIVVFGFYLFYAITKTHNIVVDISLYIISMITIFYLTYKFMHNKNLNKRLGDRNIYGIACILALFVLFTLFTVKPPKFPLFKDPVSETYGIYQTY